MVVLTEHPVLTIDNQDLSVSFTVTPSQVGAPARLVERRDSWSVMMLSNNRLHFQVREGAIWTGVTSKVPIVAGQTYRVTAVVEAGRGGRRRHSANGVFVTATVEGLNSWGSVSGW